MLNDSDNKMGHRIKSLFAFVSIDADGDEGVLGHQINGVFMAMIGSDWDRVNSLRESAQAIANSTGKKIKLIKLSQREDIETINRTSDENNKKGN